MKRKVYAFGRAFYVDEKDKFPVVETVLALTILVLVGFIIYFSLTGGI